MTFAGTGDAGDLDHLSKRALLNYLARLLQLKLSRLEQCANGAAFCQLLDAYYHGLVPMHKVNFGAKEEHDIWANYKVLQAAFVQLEITKHMDVPRLSKGHAADNLELLQWLYKFLRKKVPLEEYQPKQRRLLRKGAVVEDVPVPSCLAANFDFRKLNEGSSPGSPVSSGGGGKARVWSSRDIVGGKLDLSHVVSRYKEGLAQPVLVPRPKTTPLSPPPLGEPCEQATPAQSTTTLSTQTEDPEANGSSAESADAFTDPILFAGRGLTDDSATDADVYATRSLRAGASSKDAVAATAQALSRTQLDFSPAASTPAANKHRSPDQAVNELFTGLTSVPTAEPADAFSPTPSRATASPGDAMRSSPAMHLPPDAASLYMSALANSGYTPFNGTEVLGDALATAQDALGEVQSTIPSLQQQLEERNGSSLSGASLVLRGHLRSMLVATRTLLQHTSLLLTDVQLQCSNQGVPLSWEPEASSSRAAAAERAAALLELLRTVEGQFEGVAGSLQAMCSTPGIQSDVMPQEMDGSNGVGMALSTSQLDAVAKAVGQAQFALTQTIHKRGVALAASFLQGAGEEAGTQDPAGPSGRPTSATPSSRSTRCFRVSGGLQLKKLRNGDVYRGHYSAGKKNGDGVYHFLNHDVYEGEFKGDRMDGFGVYTFSHEGRYEGQWQSAVYAGYGTETFSKGSTYYGQYSAGLRNGCGACRFFNGDYYEGNWANGLRDGQGMQQCTDDSNYVGDYVKGKRHGHGVYSFPNGDRYQGEYADDLPHGHGVYLFASGQKYEGEWSQGKKHGWSIYTVDNGQEFVGQWLDSKPQWIQALRDPGAAAVEGNNTSGMDGEEQVPDEIQQLATTARDKAQAAADNALQCAAQHWTHSSPVSVAAAVSSAAQAAAQAQAARCRAMKVAMQLNLAVALQHAETVKRAPAA